MSTSHRLRRAATAAVVGALTSTAAVVALPTAAFAASACESDCIGAVTVNAGPEQARLSFTTTANAKISVTVKRADGTGPVQVLGGQASPFVTTHQVTTAANLDNAKEYRYEVIATDYLGGSWSEVGYFVTATRDVTVKFTKLVVIDDSDTFSAGDLVGAVHLADDGCRTPVALAPLSMTSTTQVSSGATITPTAASTLSCAKAPATIQVESQLVDDDVDGGEVCSPTFPWVFQHTSWSGSMGSNTCVDWNYATTKVTSPLAAWATGTSSKSFSMASAEMPLVTDHDPIEWTLAGTATFSQWTPSQTTGKPVSSPLHAHANTFPLDGALVASWVPVSVPGVTITGYRVAYRPAGGSWNSVTLPAGIAVHKITGLTNGTAYEVQVTARDSAGTAYGLSRTTGAPKALTQSTLSGWSTSTATLPVGTSLSSTISVTTAGTARQVLLQVRPEGAAPWQTYASNTTTGDGSATLSWPVTAGMNEWRVLAPATATHTEVASAQRDVVAATTVSGFGSGSTTALKGSTVSSTVTVDPGANRALELITRPAGTTTWTVHANVLADASGKAEVTMPVVVGKQEWAVRAAPSVAHGSGVTSAVRTIVSALAPTTVSGWITSAATLAPGTKVTDGITVTTDGTARQVKVQYRRAGTTTWYTHATAMTTAAGAATMTYPVKAGKVEWRVVAPATAALAQGVSGVRTITAKSTVAGFSTTSITTAKGTLIKDSITVTPGALRTVKVQYRKAGTTTWSTHQILTASQSGSVTVTLKALAGTTAWRVHVPATPTHGSSVTTASRSVTGK